MRRRPLLRGIAIGLGASVLGLAVLFGLIQTPPGKWLVAKIASDAASGDGLTVEFTDLGGFLPWRMTAGRIVLRDAQGQFAEASDVVLQWHPWQLVHDTWSIDDLQAARIAVQRLPVLPPAPASTTGNKSLPHMLVKRLAVAQLELGEPVLGATASLSLQAAVDNTAARTDFSFQAQRLDAPGSVKGTARFAPAGKVLDVDVVGDEPAGGVLVRLLKIDGLPALHATVQGHGSLDQWDGQLAITAGDKVAINGTATIRVAAGGHRGSLTLSGTLAPLAPASFAPLLEGKTQVDAAVLAHDDAVIDIERFTATSAGVDLTVGGKFDAQAFLADLTFDLKTKDPKRFASALPPGAAFGTLVARGTIKGAPEAPQIDAKLSASDVAVDGYRIGGLAADLKTAPAADRSMSFTLDGQASDLGADDARIAQALTGVLHLTAAGTVTAQRQIDVTKLTLTGIGSDVQFDGHASPAVVRGRLQLTHFNLAVAAPLVGHQLSGSLAMIADIDRQPDHLSVALDGHVDDFASDLPQLDVLLAPRLTLSGSLTRGADGALRADNVKARSDTLDLSANGRLDNVAANLVVRATLSDLARLDPRLSGAATADATFSGALDRLGVQATLSVPSGKAMGRDVENLQLRLTARDLTTALAGNLDLSGTIGGKKASGSATLSTADDGTRKLDPVDLAIGSVSAKGALTQGADGIVQGDMTVKAGNLADLAPLTLTDLAGSLNATVKFDSTNGRQRVTVTGNGGGLRMAAMTMASAQINLVVLDPLGTPQITGTAQLAQLHSGSLLVDQAKITASSNGAATDLRVNATAMGAAIDATGRLAAQNGAPLLTLSALKVVRADANLALTAPANIVFDKGTVRIDRMALSANGGSVVLRGNAGDSLNLNAELRGVPLSLLALVTPDIDATGTVSGTATITGSAAAPSGQYDLTIAKARTVTLTRSGLGPLDIKASGKIGGGRVTVAANVSAPSLRGIAVTGSVPLGKGELDLTIKGQAGLNLFNTALATTGTYVAGDVGIDATLRGTYEAPLASGTARISGARFNDAVNGVTLENITGELVANGRDIVVRSLTAKAGEGTLQASGNITLDPAADFPGTINITAEKARLVSNETVRLVADAKLTLSGPLMSQPRLAGRIDVRTIDVNIPDKLPGSLNATDVRHINVPNAEQPKLQTPQIKVEQRKAAVQQTAAARKAFVADLDLTISAPSRVFVRGRGLEAELGGTLRVTGTSANPITNGGFDLKHGRLDIIDRRLDFSRGRVRFYNSTDPELDFAAESKSADVTATVLVTGRASAPKISFSSNPSLPQDEILARLLFGKPASTLTPGQAIQVARAVAQFSGNGGHGLDDVRRSLGISSLDIGTDAKGGAQVGIGKRLNDSIYLGVSQGTTTNSGQVSVDIEVMKNIKVQGGAGAAGAEVGIGAEWDY